MMATYIPETILPNGSYPVADQKDISGGLHVVSSIANFASEIPLHVRKAKMMVVDSSTSSLYLLKGDLVGLDKVADLQSVLDLEDQLEEANDKLEQSQDRLDDASVLSIKMAASLVQAYAKIIEDSNYLDDQLGIQSELNHQLVSFDLTTTTTLVGTLNDLDKEEKEQNILVVDNARLKARVNELEDRLSALEDLLGGN